MLTFQQWEKNMAKYFIWVVQQIKVVGCCSGVQALPIRRYAATPVDVLAGEVTGV